MRSFLGLLLFLLTTAAAPRVSAQTVTPDTLAPEGYAPLGVGDRWEYERTDTSPAESATWLRRTVLKDTTIEGTTWVIRRDQGVVQATDDDPPTWERTEDVRRALRFDADAANVFVWQDGEAQPVYPCRLDLPVPDGGVEDVRLCSDPETSADASSEAPRYSKTVEEEPDGSVRAVLRLIDGDTEVTLQWSLGETRRVDGEVGFERVYSLVDGDRDGFPVDRMPYLPDLTPPASYVPLHVGNEWVTWVMTPFFQGYRREHITKDTTAGGRDYVVKEIARYDTTVTDPQWESDRRLILRYDPETTNVMVLEEDGTERIRYLKLGADFLECDRPPEFPECEYLAPSDPGVPTVVMVGEDEVIVPSVKTPNPGLADPGSPGLAAGLGELLRTGVNYPNEDMRFEYVRVDGVEYGVQPVASEAPPERPAGTLTVGPNPTAGRATLRFEMGQPGRVTLDVFDALGRRVLHRESRRGSGPQVVAVEAAAWAPGLYILRLTAGDVAETVRLVRR